MTPSESARRLFGGGRAGAGDAPIEDTSTPVVVLSRARSSLLHAIPGIARSLGRAGVAVYAVGEGRGMPSHTSRYLRRIFVQAYTRGGEGSYVDSLVRIGRTLGERAVLIPIDDPSALLVADHADALGSGFLFPRQPPALLRELSNKQSLHALCNRLGIPTPQSASPRSEEDLADFLEAARFPVVVKAMDPVMLHEHAKGRSVSIARAPDELVDIYRAGGGHERSNLLLQEYIPGASDSAWMFNGYFEEHSRCLISFTGLKLRQCLPETGPTSLGICASNEDLERRTVDFLSGLSYRGLVDVDFRRDARDGHYKLLDVNPRIGASFRLFQASNGLDVARALYLDLTGQNVPASPARAGRKWCVEQYDLKASLILASRRELSVRGWLRSLAGIDETAWFARDDPIPFPAMCWWCLKLAYRRAAARVPALMGRASP